MPRFRGNKSELRYGHNYFRKDTAKFNSKNKNSNVSTIQLASLIFNFLSLHSDYTIMPTTHFTVTILSYCFV
jgi:hypothetical protein